MIEEFQSVECAELDLGGKRIARVRFTRIEPSAEISNSGSESEGSASLDFILGPDIHGPGAFHRRPDSAAFAGAIEANLNDLVIYSRRQPLAEGECICPGENDITRQNDADRVPEWVGHLLVA